MELTKASVLTDEDIALVCCALRHTFKVSNNIFTVEEACKISNEGGLLKESECGCPLHVKLSENCSDAFSVFLCSLMAFLVENEGEMYSGNVSNIAVEICQFLLTRAGYHYVRVAIPGAAPVVKDSAHVRYRIGAGLDSIVVDGTPDFWGRSFTSRGVTVYIFVGETESQQAKFPIVQLAMNSLGLALKQELTRMGAVYFTKAPLRGSVFLGELQESPTPGRKNVSFKRVNCPTELLLTDEEEFKVFMETLVGLVNELLPL